MISLYSTPVRIHSYKVYHLSGPQVLLASPLVGLPVFIFGTDGKQTIFIVVNKVVVMEPNYFSPINLLLGLNLLRQLLEEDICYLPIV